MTVSSIAEVFAARNPELWVVTAAAGARRSGLIATTVAQASIVPEMPRVLVGLARQHFTWELVEAAGSFALHLIGEDHLDLVWRFGLQSGRDADKFTEPGVHEGTTGSPLLPHALGYLECRVETRMETGDRTIYLANVVDGSLRCGDPPLTMKRLFELAPSDKLRELKAQLTEDAAVDAESIRAWRLARSGPGDVVE